MGAGLGDAYSYIFIHAEQHNRRRTFILLSLHLYRGFKG